MTRRLFTRSCRTALGLLVAVVGAGAAAPAAGAQWSTAYEQFYLPGKFNWQFRHNYPGADRLFNAFDYGHAILYERLWTEPGAPVSVLEETEYNFVTRELLVHPPRVPLEEGAIEIAYAKLAPEAKLMFDWAHLFHRQVYDVWADERIPVAEKDAKVAELLRYYKSRPDLAFSSQPKTMELMEGQPYSLAFRKNYPKFNGLIWAYHWLQVGLYEPLVVGKTKDERQTGVLAAVARFRQMIENAPANMPRIMPMTASVAPTFAARYPEASIIFDNLHSMHDVVSDILANPGVPRDGKRERIMEAARRYRDATSYVQTVAEWRDMAQMMGVENMGGPSVGFLATFPTPTVERGAVMAGMDHANVAGMKNMQDTSGMRGMRHNMPGMPGMAGADSARRTRGDSMPGMEHGAMRMSDDDVMALHMRMMSDPVIRQRVLADTAMRRMMTDMADQMPVERRDMMRSMMTRGDSATAGTPRRRSGTARPAPRAAAPAHTGHEGMAMPGGTTPKDATRPATTPGAKPAAKQPPAKKPAAKDSMPGMDHSKMPGMKKP
ncbi:MAG: hypothetical protein WKG32_07470 [Gemmatimonadaceae bacterium]